MTRRSTKKAKTAEEAEVEEESVSRRKKSRGPHFVPVEDAPGPGISPRSRELLALVLVGASLYFLLALATFDRGTLIESMSGGSERLIPRSGMTNLGGSVGWAVASASVFLLGFAGWVPFVAGVVFGVALFVGRQIDRPVLKILGILVFAMMLSIALAGADGLAAAQRLVPDGPGGRFGSNLSPKLTREFGGSGRILLIAFGGLCSLLLATQWLISELLFKLVAAGEWIGKNVSERARSPRLALAEGAEPRERESRDQGKAAADPGPGLFARVRSAVGDARSKWSGLSSVWPLGSRTASPDSEGDPSAAERETVRVVSRAEEATAAAVATTQAPEQRVDVPRPQAAESEVGESEIGEPDVLEVPEPAPESIVKPAPPAPEAARRPKSKPKPEAKKPRPKPQRKPAEAVKKKAKRSRRAHPELPFEGDWPYPPASLFREAELVDDARTRVTLDANKQAIERRLGSFKVEARVVAASVGPAVTQYEVELGEGIKLSKIHGYEADLAAALKAVSVRVVAPIPGKHTVGIEVPNAERQTVVYRELLDRFGLDEEKAIPLYLGKDVTGEPVVEDLAKMPHLLIAGTTGSGKSVCINAILLSVLTTRTPQQVRLVLIDPKMVELQVYKKVPHLACEVVTSMKKAPAVLQWAVDEMERRYELLSRVGTNHIRNYNRLGREEIENRLGSTIEDGAEQLPYIVLVIDELADLMTVAQREVEESIQRLAQKSRAVGLHVILATQRPSTDVITGVIKANLPAQIAFKVNRKIDSRVILDSNGAEKLLGHGDMLYLTPSTQEVRRAQGAFVSEEETKAVVDWLAEHGPEPDYIPDLVQSDTGKGRGHAAQDELYEQAVEVVLGQQRGSATLIQRALAVGYNRATRLLEMMEDDSLVGPFVGSKSRDVLLTMEEWRAREEAVADELAGGDDEAEYEEEEYVDDEEVDEDAGYDDESEADAALEEGSEDAEEADAEEGEEEWDEEWEYEDEDEAEEAEDSEDPEALHDEDEAR